MIVEQVEAVEAALSKFIGAREAHLNATDTEARNGFAVAMRGAALELIVALQTGQTVPA